MVISTTRFGDVSVTEEDILTLDEGLLGFSELHKFVLLDDPGDEIFAWLQSCELADIAFPVLEPELFDQNFKLTLTKHDMSLLGAQSMERLRAFSIITITTRSPKKLSWLSQYRLTGSPAFGLLSRPSLPSSNDQPPSAPGRKKTPPQILIHDPLEFLKGSKVLRGEWLESALPAGEPIHFG